MNLFKTTIYTFLLSLIVFSGTVFAQTQENSSVLDRVNTYLNGDSQQNVYVNKNSTKRVSVTIADLNVTDKLSMAGSSIFNAFKGSENLVVNELNFTPDFDQNCFFLSFNVEDDQDTRIVILDVKGSEIHNENIADFTGTYESKINLPSNSKGTYFLKIIQGFSLLNKKLVLE
ncbi:MAG: hypothetical protein IPI59_11985 [Sphingobacteriales bacterium]|jgi:hypothetical protein|nr:hypothetical protein [Sphingobacteriales bacterium]MBP9142462.1 hypothetical protein [Chitinophagales bacterium]MDA0198582.1 hypothetical protein [Bacteroidota bacterium]MBK6889247.1 hypothetical protein [Sphingobacteriales bacterium]MBK7528247.1 hypothetical protein [Sphingobacteriales bacterium]